jgi:transposase
MPDSKSRQASRGYEFGGQTCDVLLKIPEPRDALCFHDEFSGIVRILEDYYKHFGEARPACPLISVKEKIKVEQPIQEVTEQTTTKQEPEFAAWVGIDWADKKHYWSLRTAEANCLERGTLDNTPEAVEIWMMELQRRFHGRAVAIALEQRKGALVVMLGKYEHAYLYPVNPVTLARFREAWYPSGTKNDARDADLLLEVLTKHREHLRRLDPDIPEMRQLQFQVENRRKLVDERTALANKLKDTLKIYFPQIPLWFEDVSTELVCDLLAKWPTLEELRKARPAALQKFFHQHRSRNEETIGKRIADIRNAVPATRDEAVIVSAQPMVRAWIGQLAIVRQSIREIEGGIAELARRQEDWCIFDSFPGAGPVMAPRLMAVMGTHRDRFDSAHELQCFAGIAPVTEASGNSLWTHFRRACPKFVRQTFHEWAACSIPQCQWAKDLYDRLKAKGKSHHVAIRAIAFKWMRILYRCWKNREPYREDIYLTSLAKRSVPLQRLVASVKMP